MGTYYTDCKDVRRKKCSELKYGDQVVFRIDPYYCNNKSEFFGHVLWVNKNNTVCVSYLEGYKDRTDDVPFVDMLGVFDKDGLDINFGGVSGRSILLIPE